MIALPINGHEVVLLRIDALEGSEVADLRVWVTNRAGEDVPTRKGLTVKLALLPDLIDGLRTLEADARARGLLQGQ